MPTMVLQQSGELDENKHENTDVGLDALVGHSVTRCASTVWGMHLCMPTNTFNFYKRLPRVTTHVKLYSVKSSPYQRRPRFPLPRNLMDGRSEGPVPGRCRLSRCYVFVLASWR